MQLVDLRASDAQELSALIGEASAVVVPTWPASADAELQASVGTLLAALKTKQWVGCYDAFGGDDEPIDTVASQLRGLGQKTAFEPLRIRQVPDGQRLPALRGGRHRPGPAAHQGEDDRGDEEPSTPTSTRRSAASPAGCTW